jgi:hypothetical protein
MPHPLNITGTWVGHYVQRDHPHGISANLVQTGNTIHGSMRDRDNENECSLYEATASAGLPPGADEQIAARLRELVPDEPRGPIRYVSYLPPDSILEGSVKGREVYFLKRYQGAHFGGYRVGDKRVGTEIPEHQVHYLGYADAERMTIEGTWWIDPRPEIGGRRTEGTFVLRRQT